MGYTTFSDTPICSSLTPINGRWIASFSQFRNGRCSVNPSPRLLILEKEPRLSCKCLEEGSLTQMKLLSEVWVCLKIGYIPNYSHLIGIIMIMKTIGFRGTQHIQTHPYRAVQKRILLQSSKFVEPKPWCLPDFASNYTMNLSSKFASSLW